MEESKKPNVRALVLDATPLITQPYSHYQNLAESFYTTPTVFSEIRDPNARKNLDIWKGLGSLKLRHPKSESIARVSRFAKLTGDYMVLSANDIHILALAYELETELNKGDWRLRKKPGDSLNHAELTNDKANTTSKENDANTEVSTTQESAQTEKKKNRRRGGKRQKEKKAQRENAQEQEQEEPSVIPKHDTAGEKNDDDDDDDDDGDGDWISVDNLTEMMIRDSGQDPTGSQWMESADTGGASILESPSNQVALASGDFAVQNVALQLNLNLMNFMSGLRIRTLRNYMLRCHACFRIFPLPKDGKQRHFCPSCGSEKTLLRCAVSVDAQSGEITPHLKANFQWTHRGNRYSLASPLSKNSQKKYGKKGYVHSQPQEVPILREDQTEYRQMMSREEWTRKHNEKVLDNYIGDGTADNYLSPFAIQGLKHHAVHVGKGRYVNSSRKRR